MAQMISSKPCVVAVLLATVPVRFNFFVLKYQPLCCPSISSSWLPIYEEITWPGDIRLLGFDSSALILRTVVEI